jgi:hypothetical protein
MVKVFKVKDQVIGKIANNRGRKGIGERFEGSGRRRKYWIKYDNGQEKLETARAIDNCLASSSNARPSPSSSVPILNSDDDDYISMSDSSEINSDDAIEGEM